MTAKAVNPLAPPAGPLASPLDARELRALNQALQGLSPTQLAWVSGYLAGASARAHPFPAQTAPAAATAVTILYGSQTGNARRIAEQLGQQATARGQGARVLSMADYRPRELARERLLLIVVSTHGEGEPPDAARELHGFLLGQRAPRLETLEFAVLGLGDSSYEHFCQTAQEIDQRLSELGARRVLTRVCCDVDFQDAATDWSRRVLEEIDRHQSAAPARPWSAEIITLPGVTLERQPRYDSENPYQAPLIERRRLTTDDAVGDVRHLAFALDSHQLDYSPGDALGVWFQNDPALIDQLLSVTGLSAETPVSLDGQDLSLGQALLERLELTQLHPASVQGWSRLNGDHRLTALVEDPARLRAYARAHQVIDLLAEFPLRPCAQDLTGLLKPLKPRLYSIASSQAEHADEVHLTLSVVRWQDHGRSHLGGASGFLAERLAEDGTTGVYVVENPAFRLPEDGDTPIVLIGAGTGIAPYRAFLQQRAADGASGRNWLIFGNRHFHRDFLYQLDWQAWRKAGLLSRTSLAFSRDGARSGQERVYVQQRLREQAAEVYRWIDEGAHLYVCGATAMGQAVHEALLGIAAQVGGFDPGTAGEFLEGLRGEGRYHRDLY